MATDAKEFLIKILADQDAAFKTARTIADVKSRLISLGDLPPAAGDNVKKLNDSFVSTKERIQAAKEEVTALGDEIEKSFGKIEKVNGGAGLKRVGEIGSRLGFGEAGRGLSTIGDFSNFDQLKKELSALPPAAIAAGVAVGGFTLLLDAYTKAQEQARQAALADLDARQRAFALLQSGSNQEIQLRINQLAKDKQLAESAAAQSEQFFQHLREDVFQNLGAGALGLEDAASLVGKAAGQFQAARDSAVAARDGVSKLDVELQLLEKQSGLTAQTVEDAATAEKHRQDALYITSNIQNQVSAQIEKYNLAATGSSKSLEDRQRQLQTEITINQNAADQARYRLETEKLSQEEQQALVGVIDDLTKKNNALKTSLNELSDPFVSTSIKAREAAQAQIDAGKDLAKIKDEAAKDSDKQSEALKSINDKTAESYKKLADAYRQAGLDVIAKRALDDAKERRRQADEDAKQARERQKQIADLDKTRDEKVIQAEIDKNKELERIGKEFALSEKSAIQDRDAIALQSAIDKRNADTDAANETANSTKAAAEKERKDRLAELQAEYAEQDKETAIARANAARELAIARRAEDAERRAKYQRDQQALAENNRVQIAQQVAAYNKQISDLQAYLAERIKTDQGYFAEVLVAAKAFQIQLGNALNGTNSTSSSTSTPTTHTVPTNAVALPGTRVAAPNDLLAFSYGGTTSKGAGVNIPITVNGQGKEAVKAQINTHIDEIWQGMGW